MATLHQVTEKLHVLFKWSAIIVVSTLLILLTYQTIKNIFFPTKPAPPTVAFGKLPPIIFPQTPISDKKLTYTIDTVTGTLPTFPDRAAVFTVIPPKPTLLALDIANNRVANVGFITPGVAKNDTLYEWSAEDPFVKRLDYDILSNNFRLTSNYMTDADVLQARNLPNETGAIEKAKEFLTNLSSYPEDIDEEKTKTTLFRLNGQTLAPATSLSNSNIIRVDYFQKDIEKLPILYNNPITSPMHVLIAGEKQTSFNRGRIVEADFFYQKIGSPSATYPIKAAQEAYNELENGKAYIASYNGILDDIQIRNIFLGYYLSEKKQAYLLPIVVFEGDDNFTAYLPAIKDEWIRTE